MDEELDVVHLFAGKFEAAMMITDKFIESSDIQSVIIPEEEPWLDGLEPFVIIGTYKAYEIHTIYKMPFFDYYREKNS